MDKFLKEAINEAKTGLSEGGIPIGSVVVKNNVIVGRGHNKRVQNNSAILHAEMAALEDAGRHAPSFYEDCVLYTTLSPCHMCTGAILLYKIPHIVIGENRTFKGPEHLLTETGVKITQLDDEECYTMMQNFIDKNPALWYEDIAESKHQ